MITIEFVRSIHDGRACEPEVVARATADGQRLTVDGSEPEVVDAAQRVVNLRDGRTITQTDNAEEWLRGLAVSFRTPYLSARVVEDTNPLPDIEIAQPEIREPISR